MTTTTRTHHSTVAAGSPSGPLGCDGLSIPLHLAPYAAEVDQWHREAVAAQAARAAR